MPSKSVWWPLPVKFMNSVTNLNKCEWILLLTTGISRALAVQTEETLRTMRNNCWREHSFITCFSPHQLQLINRELVETQIRWSYKMISAVVVNLLNCYACRVFHKCCIVNFTCQTTNFATSLSLNIILLYLLTLLNCRCASNCSTLPAGRILAGVEGHLAIFIVSFLNKILANCPLKLIMFNFSFFFTVPVPKKNWFGD